MQPAGKRQMDRILTILKKNFDRRVSFILSLELYAVFVYDHYIQTCLCVYISDLR